MSPQSSLAAPFESSSPDAIFNLGMAALILTIFGFTWLGWGFSAEHGLSVAGWILFYVATMAMVGASGWIVRRGKGLMAGHSRDGARWVRNRQQFRRVGLWEGVGCAVVVFLTVTLHRVDLMAAGISLVVGVHFLPLASLFRFRAYYATGSAIIICDLLSVALFRSDVITVSAGIGTGIILWITTIYVLFCSRRLLRELPSMIAHQ